MALSPPNFLAIDASTTALRATVFDAIGNRLGTGKAELAVLHPEPDGYEQDANSWWRGLISAVREALSGLSETDRGVIVAMVIAHQRETIVLTDAQGEPLGSAILWMDSRCLFDVHVAERNMGSVRLHALSGKPPCTTPSLYKLMYLMRTRPEVRDVACVHDVHSFLCKKLTGRNISSFASADPWGLVDMRQKKWSSSLLKLIGLESHQLPELVEPGYLIGPLKSDVLTTLGLPAHILLYAGTGDAQASGLGAGVVTPGRCFVEMGTAVTAGVLVESYQIDQAYRTLFAAIPGMFSLETTLRGGMQTLFWWLEAQLGKTARREALQELEELATALPPGSDGLLALPYWAGVMNPYWDDQARGALLGLHPGHQPAHVFRAVLEGIACEVRLHLEGIEASAGKVHREVVVLGGGSRNRLWCQILADVLGRTVIRSESAEATSLGASVMAATAHGVYSSFDQATREMTRLGQAFEPAEAQPIYERLYRDAYRGLYQDIRARLRVLSSIRHSTDTPIIPSVEFPET